MASLNLYPIKQMATLLKGDCLQVMATLPDKSVDCFVCDLPFGALIPAGTSDVPSKWDVPIDLPAFWRQVKRLARNANTPVLMFCSTKFGYDLITSNRSWFRYDLVWDKQVPSAFLLANKMPLKGHEMVYVFSKAGAYYKRIDIEGEFPSWNSHNRLSSTNTVVEYSGRNIAEGNDGTHRCPTSIITVRKTNRRYGHPTEKPLDLYDWLLQRYCPEGGTMLDPTAGSFNSLVAARRLGLKGIGIERDSGYFWSAVAKFATQ